MGSPRLVVPGVRRMLYLPRHPLATKNGYVSETRAVLYARLGPGWHRCHWCGIWIRWIRHHGARTHRRGIVGDHIDGNWRNNLATNLVPACQRCNGTRWMDKVRDDEIFITRRNGTRVRVISRTCELCGQIFMIPPAALAIPPGRRPRGRFCSRSCARRAPH